MLISCVIPFYNEARRIGPIVDIVIASKIIDEVILVDDGSTDGGYSCHKSKLTVHRFETNRGKSEAMRYGFDHSKGEIIIFVDADLSGLTERHIDQLLEPLLSGKYDLAVSQREHLTFFDVVSGERALRRNTWLSFFASSNYQRNALEIAMNHSAFANSLKIKWVAWRDVSQTYKSQKISWATGASKDIRNVVDWMIQLGFFRFGCAYLLSWMMIMNEHGWVTRKYASIYQKMYRV